MVIKTVRKEKAIADRYDAPEMVPGYHVPTRSAALGNIIFKHEPAMHGRGDDKLVNICSAR